MTEPPLDFIRRNAPVFARVGSVVATYRTRGNRRFGPYYRLIYRQHRRQHSLYLGPSEQRAAQVRQLLAELQRPRDDRLAIRRSHRLRKATLLQLKREWQHVARVYGLRPHGWNVRGLRALGWPRIDKITATKRVVPTNEGQLRTSDSFCCKTGGVSCFCVPRVGCFLTLLDAS